MELKALVARQAELGAEMDELTAGIAKRFRQAEAGEMSYAKCDEYNADDRERIHELAYEVAGVAEDLVQLLTKALPVVQEALGDAYAYRTDSGEEDEDDLEDHEAEACERYRKLADLLGVTID